jgi:apolipoprotein N-acyltransferase
LVFALLTGLISAAAFAPLSLWPLMPLAFAVLLHLLGGATTLRRALAIGWCFGFGQFVVGLNWIATAFTYQAAMPAWLGWVAVLVLSLYLAVFPAMAAGLAWRWRGRAAMPFTLAAAWMVTEWLRGTLFTGFAWNPVGVAWVGTPVGHAAPLVGTFGLSALAILTGAAVLALVRRDRRTFVASVTPPALAALSALLAPATPPGTLPVHVVQPNIDQDARNAPDYAYAGLYRLARLSPRPAPGAPPRLVMWPEAAVEYYLDEDPDARAALATLLRPGDILLTGGSKIEHAPDGTWIGARNSLWAMDATGRLLARYDKAHLVPYGEYLPMRPLLSAIGLSRLVPGDLDYWEGPGPQSIAIPGFGAVGVQICYEIIFSGHVIDPRHRPAFLFNPSNDAWFGAWGPPQHLAQARLRAIEEGMTIVRSTPNGISAVIDPAGRLLATVPRHRVGTIDMAIPAAAPPTPFARLGNLLPLLFGGLLVLAAIAMRRAPR